MMETRIFNINTVGMLELTFLPGIGITTASNIIAYREEHGDFQSLNDLRNVSGISARVLSDNLYNLTTREY